MLAAQHSIVNQSSAANKLPILGLVWQRVLQVSSVRNAHKAYSTTSDPNAHSARACCPIAVLLLKLCIEGHYKLLLGPRLSAS